MGPWHRCALAFVSLTTLTTAALAQPSPPPGSPGDPTVISPDPTAPPPDGTSDTGAPAPAETKPKPPGRGDFDAGGQVRLPNGPDEAGAYATFNWVALDLKGRYFVFDTVTLNGNVPLAVIKPDSLMGGAIEPSMIGGGTVTLEAKLPKLPKMPGIKHDTEMGLTLTGAYMREGAMLLSEKDYPLFVGDMHPGFAGGLLMKIKLSSLIDFSLTPTWVFQSGTVESATAVQVPMSTIVKLGEVVKVSVDLGVFTGDDYAFGGGGGGRIATGGALDLKIGPIITHAGAGVASLLSGGAYPSIRDSFYVDLNVKYAK